MSKSAIYVVNSGAQAVDVDGTISLGGIVRRFGCAVDLNGSAVNITAPGFYDASVAVTVAPTAAGTVTVTMFNNGVAVPGATASATVAGAADAVSLAFESLVRVPCSGNSGSLSLVLTGAAATVSNVAMVVEKL